MASRQSNSKKSSNYNQKFSESRKFENDRNRFTVSNTSGAKSHRNEQDLCENLENKLKFQESFGIDRRSSRHTKDSFKSTRKVNNNYEKSESKDVSSRGQYKDLRELLNSKKQEKSKVSDRLTRISDRLSPKIKEDGEIEGPKSSDTNKKFEEPQSSEIVKDLQSDEKSSQEANDKVQNPPRVRKQVRIRNPGGRLADLVRLQVVDAVEKNRQRENSSSSTGSDSKSASQISLIEISSSSDGAKAESDKVSLERSIERMGDEFEDILSSEDEDWLEDIKEEEQTAEKSQTKLTNQVSSHVTMEQPNKTIQNRLVEEKNESEYEAATSIKSTSQFKSSANKIDVIVSNRPENQFQVETNQYNINHFNQPVHFASNPHHIPIQHIHPVPSHEFHRMQSLPMYQTYHQNSYPAFNNSMEYDRFQQRTPSPNNSISSSSSSSSVTDLFGAPSKLEARLRKIRRDDSKLSNENMTSSTESIKSNGFNANAKAFYPRNLTVKNESQPQIVTDSASTESVYHDSHHSFDLAPYVGEESKRTEDEECDKLTEEQMTNLLYVTKTTPKYMQEALSYYMEYYEELGEDLCKNAVDEILTEKGIDYKSCDFNSIP